MKPAQSATQPRDLGPLLQIAPLGNLNGEDSDAGIPEQDKERVVELASWNHGCDVGLDLGPACSLSQGRHNRLQASDGSGGENMEHGNTPDRGVCGHHGGGNPQARCRTASERFSGQDARGLTWQLRVRNNPR